MQNDDLAEEGMMFVGAKGKILAGFRGENPRLLSGQKSQLENLPKRPRDVKPADALVLWVAACKGGEPTFGDFLLAGPISDAFNLGAVSLRMGGERLQFDAANMKITNLAEANPYLRREYRKGWELTGPGA
jgi:hypothetical protein